MTTPAFRYPRPATSTATASTTSSSEHVWRRPRQHAPLRATATWCSARPRALRRRSTSPRSRPATAASSSTARTRATAPAFRSPRPATSTATASTTSSSGHSTRDGPGNTRYYAGDSYVVFGHAGGFAAEIDLAASRPATAASSSMARMRAIAPAFRCPRPATSTATASTTSSSGHPRRWPRQHPRRCGRQLRGVRPGLGLRGEIDLAAVAAGNGGFVIHGQDATIDSGPSVSSAGDVNGDGFDDLIIGAYVRRWPRQHT